MSMDNYSSIYPISNFYRVSAADFEKIPGNPIAYWVSDKVRKTFNNTPSLSAVAQVKHGMTTGNNEKFLRLWYEVSNKKIEYNCLSTVDCLKALSVWYPYNKGGIYRKWYGNRDFVVKYYKLGEEMKNGFSDGTNTGCRIVNESDFFKECITWADVTSGPTSFRYCPNGAAFDGRGSSLFSDNHDLSKILLLLNTKNTEYYLRLLNPTLVTTIADISKIPFIDVESVVTQLSSNLITHAKSDWDSYETSWDFTTLPLLQPEFHQLTLRETYTKLRAYWKEMTQEMQQLEEENNRIFIEAYGLQDELTPEVPLSEITLTCNPYYRYNGDRSEEELESLLLTDTIKEFISYAVGCMFGRYSLDKLGLVLANQGEKIGDYLEQMPEPSFIPDTDNIIPILEDEYFEDDIVGRFKEFLKVTFGEDTLSENLDFIAEALGGNGKKSSEAVIRDYFLKSFYKDHVKMYKKRPIYWLFSSGKGRAFNALIYIHRYNKETLAMMRTDYLLELEGKLDAKREMIKSDIGKDAQEKARLGKMIDEIMEYDELLKNKADEYIEIDLDDGVKVNYERFEGLVEKI